MTDKSTPANTPISQQGDRGYMGYKLEIGKHTFKERILKNCIYVDKTQHIYELMSRDSNCFLSRPRRFGKSLLISTFKEIFSGSKELFKNCWIYDKIEWEEYPIIHLDFLDIRFLFITGVSKFSRISIFSDLNHLNDITIYPQYATMLGYTKEEFEHYFSYYIDDWERVLSA